MSSSLSLIYDQNIDEQVYQFYLNIVNEHIENDQVIIDCGCGSGNLTKYLETISSQVFAFDIDSNMIDLASRKTKKTIYKKWDMHDSWPFYGDVVIMSMDVINFTDKPFQVIDHAIESIDNHGMIFMDIYDDKVNLTHHEDIQFPIAYQWDIKHEKNILKHTIKTNQETIHITQYIHPLHSIKEYLIEKGFAVQIIQSIDPRKLILICKG